MIAKPDFLIKILIFSALIVFSGNCLAQTGNNVDKNRPKKDRFGNSKPRHKKKRIVYWIKKDGKGLLLGNKCFEDFTHRMGFEYLLQPKGSAGNRSEFGRLLHNFGTKLTILFRNGPFWKFKLNKQREECRRSSGDFVG
ncbi:MAG: hypothetical protein AAFX87_17085 [Bacteroidota bacterium]